MDAALRLFFALLFGLAVGSFLTVAVYRIPRKESVVAPRSKCPSCGAQILAKDNIPVLSYLLLRGRCRACGARISPRYLLLEIATAALFAGAALGFENTYKAVLVALFFAVMLALAVIDAERRIVPNRIVYPSLIGFGLLVAIGAVWGDHLSLAGAGLGFLAYGGALLLVALVARGGMGMGDVKLAALIGLVLGSLGLRYVAVAAAMAIFAGGIGALGLMAFAGASRKHAIPFGPYLAGGAVVAAFVAPRLAAWYTALAR